MNLGGRVESDRRYSLGNTFRIYTDIQIIHINDIEIRVTLSMMKKIIKVGNKLIELLINLSNDTHY